MFFSKNPVLRSAVLWLLMVGACLAAAAEQPLEQKEAGKDGGGNADGGDGQQEEGEGDGTETVGLNPIVGNLVGAGIVAVLGLIVYLYFRYCRSASADSTTAASSSSGQTSTKVEYSKVATDDVEKGLGGSRGSSGATSIRGLSGGGPRIELSAGRSRDLGRAARSSTSRSPSPSSTASSESPSAAASSSYEETGAARQQWDDWEGEAPASARSDDFDAPEAEDENADFLSHGRSNGSHPQHIHAGGVIGQDVQSSINGSGASSISSLGAGRLGGLSSSKGKLAKSPAPKQASAGKSRAFAMSPSANVNDDLFESIGLSAKPKFNETSSVMSSSSPFKANSFGSSDPSSSSSKYSPGGASRKQRVADIAAAEESSAAWGGAEDDITFDD